VRIDDGVKREVLARTDIAEFIGQFVTLRKRGNDLVGLCPFHTEKSPSFHVHADRGFFKCFGCGVGGDAIKFVQLHDNLTFPDALRVLAKRAGVEVEPENPQAARMRSEKEAIYHANDVATQFFHRMLLLDPRGAAARAYCESRGITRASIESFKLGFAPESWDALANELRANGVEGELAAKAGLLKPGQRGHYDFYRNRLMIPTYATTGEVIAFGGRALGDDPPKYLNTATTPVYTKGRFLYALGSARRAAAKDDAVIVVEGYLDCIALHQAGFTNAVASLGTAFTPEQARELRKVASRVYLCFDADDAGRAATLKSLDLLVAEGVTPWILRIPGAKDPDDFLRAHGAEAFRAGVIDAAISATQFKLDATLDVRDVAHTDRAALARWAEETLQQLAPRQEWDRWRVYVAGRLDLSVDDLRKSRLVADRTHFAPRRPGEAVRHARHLTPGTIEPPTFEREVLAIVADEPLLLGEFAARIPAASFTSTALRRIYAACVEHREELLQPSDVLALFAEDDDASSTLTGILGAERSATIRFKDSDERRAHLERVVARLASGDLERRYKELGARIDRLFEAGERVPTDLRDEHAALSKKLKG
jgi:DNA primase